MTNKTQTPAQALGEVIHHRSANDFAGPMVWHDIDDNEWSLSQREFMASCVNLAVQHGQHFAGLEARIVDLERERDTYCAQNRALRDGVAPMLKRSAQAEELLAIVIGDSGSRAYHGDQLHDRVAAFLAENGETKVMAHPEQAARDMLERMGFEDAKGMTAGDVGALANLIANSRRYEARCVAACAMAWRICNFSDSEMRDGDAAREECAAFLASGETK